jgi:uncharacterized protein
MAASYLIYRRVGGADPATAWFSAMPGGLTDMMFAGERQGGHMARIALAHAARILVVVSFIVVLYAMVFHARSDAPTGRWIGLDALSVRDWLLLGLAGLVGAVAGERLHLPAAAVLGPMIASAALHVAGLVTVAPPTLTVIGAQIAVGTIVGCRFLGTPPGLIVKDIALGTLAAAAMMAIAGVFALLAVRLGGLDLAQVFLAFAPGGLTEMSLIALAMGQDPAFVTALHVVRLVLVIGLADLLFRRIVRPR